MTLHNYLGADINLPDTYGNTPLHYAAKYGHLELCKYVVDQGANVSYKNKQSQTAYDVSESHHAIRQYLLPLVLQHDRNVPERKEEANYNSYNALPTYVGTQNFQQPSSTNVYLPPKTTPLPPSTPHVPPPAPTTLPSAHPGTNFSSHSNTINIVPSIIYGQPPPAVSNPPIDSATSNYHPTYMASKPNNVSSVRAIQPG